MNAEERPSAPNSISPFERIRRTNAAGAEYWSSREFAQVLGYPDYHDFEQVTNRAKTACFNGGEPIHHFVEITEMIESGTMPENLPPAESIKKLESKRRRQPETLTPPSSETDITSNSREKDGV